MMKRRALTEFIAWYGFAAMSMEERFELERRAAEVETRYGRIQVKIAVRPDGSTRAVPEYESVRRAADAAGVPAADVYEAALRATADGI